VHEEHAHGAGSELELLGPLEDLQVLQLIRLPTV
jgi:hypothetical protein